MNKVSYEIFKMIARHITVCMDNKQQLYEEGSSEIEVLHALGLPSHSVSLLKGYRCSPYIVQLASRFIEKEADKEYFIRQTMTSIIDIETPVIYYADSFDNEKEHLINILQSRQLNNEKIAILFPLRRQVYGYAVGLREAGLDVEDLKSLDFGSDTPKLLTYHSAKSLTFDTVLLPRVVQSSFSAVGDQRVIDRQLFVAITRAIKWVYISTVNGKEIELFGRIGDLADNGDITVQYAGDLMMTGDGGQEDGNGDKMGEDGRELDIF